MKTILFISYGGGHVNLLLPVFRQLILDENCKCEFLALTMAGVRLQEQGIPYLGFKDMLEPGDDQASAYGRELVGEEATGSMVVPYEESIAYMGLSFWDLVHRHGEEEADRIYREDGGRQAFYPITPLRRFLNKKQPDLIVTTNSPRAEQAAIDAATDLGIASVCVVDLFAFQEVRWIGKPGFATRVCVLSEFVRQMMIDAGRGEDEVIVTGNPAFDNLSTVRDSNTGQSFRAEKGWRDDEQVVLWASNVEPKVHPFSAIEGNPELPRQVEVQLLQLIQQHKNIRVVFRPHPNDSYRPETLPERAELSTSDENLDTLLAAVDCVVVLSSTVGLQAALMGKPLVNIKLSIFSRDAPYDDMGISIGVDDVADLNASILRALAEGQAGTGLPETGTATEKVVNVIKTVLDGSA
jgi:hypothetical protein